ncbi:hypothetical protein [Rhodopseudomonas sp. AAP120]|uniref:hypothetical protein n=1 Tax=Rhodopseudomonas sp. AAP120 TaxID=1523430 RepID=UPI000A7A2DDB|nr:hypothetical protein [Rhodopseudomonas sp. AAP120]
MTNWESHGSVSGLLLADYDSELNGPLFAVSDDGSAGGVVVDAAFASAKAIAGATQRLALGVVLDGERMTSAGEVPIGPPEYAALRDAAAGRLLLTTNVGTRVNVRLTGQLPEFAAVEASADAIVAAFQPFLDTPDRRPRPLTVRLLQPPGADTAPLAALVARLENARRDGRIGPSAVHRLSILVAFNAEIESEAQLTEIERVIAAAADLAIPEVAVDGEMLPYARRRWGGQGLLNVLGVAAANRLLKAATARGVRLAPRYLVDVESAARTIWTGLQSARTGGFDAGKYGLLPLTLEEQVQVIELITRWTTGWSAIPAFYVDTPLVTATEVFEVNQCEAAARRWLKAARGAGATTVLFDAPDRVTPRKLVQSPDSSGGVLTVDQIAALRDYGRTLGVNVLWSGGITARQAFELARRRVFGIFSTSSTATKVAVTAPFERDPRLPAESKPTEEGVRRIHAIVQAGFLASRLLERDAKLSAALAAAAVELADHPAGADVGLPALDSLLVEGWRKLWGETGSAAEPQLRPAKSTARVRPVPADAVRVFRGRKKAESGREGFVHRLGEVFMPMTIQVQRLYGLSAYLPAVVPVAAGSTLPDEVALVFYRTQDCYHEAKRCIGGRAYSEMHELAFDMAQSHSGFPQLLATDTIAADQPYHLFERSVDWQVGSSRLYIGTRKPSLTAEAYLQGLAAIVRNIQRDGTPLDAAVFSATADWLVWWDHAPTPVDASVVDFAAVTDRVFASPPRNLRVPSNLSEPYSGVTLDPRGDFLNLQFKRLD